MVNRGRKKNENRRRTKDASGLMETAHLLRFPRNAQRLLKALRRAETGKSKAQSLDKLKREMGLGTGE